MRNQATRSNPTASPDNASAPRGTSRMTRSSTASLAGPSPVSSLLPKDRGRMVAGIRFPQRTRSATVSARSLILSCFGRSAHIGRRRDVVVQQVRVRVGGAHGSLTCYPRRPGQRLGRIGLRSTGPELVREGRPSAVSAKFINIATWGSGVAGRAIAVPWRSVPMGWYRLRRFQGIF